MGQVIARLMKEDGKYHYGTSTNPAPELGKLFAISAVGGEELPEFPHNPASPIEHTEWLDSLEARGWTVAVTEIEESSSN